MLDFWYSERCTREIKLIVSILTCIVSYYCSNIEKLSPILTVSCLIFGMAIHVLKIQTDKISRQNPYAQGFRILFSTLPIAIFIFIICILPSQNKIFTAIQAVGFSALGLFIVSIYQNRAKRFE